MTSLYDFIVQHDGRGFDVWDTEWECPVCWDLPDGNDSWARVCRWMEKNIEVVEQTSKCEVCCRQSDFIRANIELFKEFTRDHNDERYIVKGLDEHSIYSGVLTINGLMVGNYSDKDYLDLARMLNLTGKGKKTKKPAKKKTASKSTKAKSNTVRMTFAGYEVKEFPRMFKVGPWGIEFESASEDSVGYQGWLSFTGDRGVWGNVNVELNPITGEYNAWLDYGKSQSEDPKTKEYHGRVTGLDKLHFTKEIGDRIWNDYQKLNLGKPKKTIAKKKVRK